MTVPEINYIAVLLATISTMVVGAVWYAPKVFGSYWMAKSGITPNDGAPFIRPMVITLIVSFITAWVLAGAAFISFHFYGGSFFWNAVLTAVILWAGFTAARFVTHDQFDRRAPGLTLLNCAHELVTMLVMAIIIGVWPA